jgi:hypothetical protein
MRKSGPQAGPLAVGPGVTDWFLAHKRHTSPGPYNYYVYSRSAESPRVNATVKAGSGAKGFPGQKIVTS